MGSLQQYYPEFFEHYESLPLNERANFLRYAIQLHKKMINGNIYYHYFFDQDFVEFANSELGNIA